MSRLRFNAISGSPENITPSSVSLVGNVNEIEGTSLDHYLGHFRSYGWAIMDYTEFCRLSNHLFDANQDRAFGIDRSLFTKPIEKLSSAWKPFSDDPKYSVPFWDYQNEIMRGFASDLVDQMKGELQQGDEQSVTISTEPRVFIDMSAHDAHALWATVRFIKFPAQSIVLS
jgi:hypothetical protein